MAWLDETNVRVAYVIQSWAELGRDPEAVQSALPALSMGQIYAALSYHYDHPKPA